MTILYYSICGIELGKKSAIINQIFTFEYLSSATTIYKV